MTEIDKIKRAKMYLDKLANGVDPINDTEIHNDSVLSNERISKCFLFVSDILRQVINNGGIAKAANSSGKNEFDLPEEKRRTIVYSQESTNVSGIIAKLNDLINVESMKKLTATMVTGWLLAEGYLAQKESQDGTKSRLPTKKGEDIGLSTQLMHGNTGDYYMVLYNEQAQRFVVDNLDSILQEYRSKNTIPSGDKQ